MDNVVYKPTLCVGFIGPVNSGKTCILSEIIQQYGNIPQSTIIKANRAIQNYGFVSKERSRFFLDRLKIEQERRISIIPHITNFETPKFRVTAIDTPGHRSIMKNFLRGFFMSEVVVLVVESTWDYRKEYYTLIDQIIAMKAVGITQIIVCIHQMDRFDYSKEEYEKFVEYMKEIFEIYHKNAQVIQYIPTSLIGNQNIFEKSELLNWYKGASLVESIDKFQEIKRNYSDDLRLSIFQKFRVRGVGEVAIGKIERGILSLHHDISTHQNSERVLSICLHGKDTDVAFPGDVVGVHFHSLNLSTSETLIGSIWCSNSQTKSVGQFRAQVEFVRSKSSKNIIKTKFHPVLLFYSFRVTCKMRITEIDENTESIKLGKYVVDFETIGKKKIQVEKFSDVPQFGRFIMVDKNFIIGFGEVIEFKEVEDKFKKVPSQIPNFTSDEFLAKYDHWEKYPFSIMFSEKLKNDETMALKLTKIRPSNVQYLSEKFRSSWEFMKEIVKLDNQVFQYATEDIKNKNEIVEYIIKYDPDCIRYISFEWKDNTDMMFKAVSLNGSAIQYISKRLQQNEKFIKKALESYGQACIYTPNFKFNKEESLKIVRSFAEGYCYIDNDLRGDEEIITEAIKNYPDVFPYIPSEFITKSIALEVITKRPERVFQLKYKKDMEFMKQAVERNPHCYYYAPSYITQNLEIALIALKDFGYMRHFIDPTLIDHPKIVEQFLNAVSAEDILTGKVSGKMRERMSNDIETRSRVLQKNPFTIALCPDEVQSDEILIHDLLDEDVNVYRVLIEKWRNKYQIVAEVVKKSPSLFTTLPEHYQNEEIFWLSKYRFKTIRETKTFDVNFCFSVFQK